MRLTLLFLCALWLTGSALPVAVAPAAVAPAATPSCPAPSYRDGPALLAALSGAPYACAEEIAAALAPRASPQIVAALLEQAAAGADTRARRNALRALGRLAEQPRGSRSHDLLRRSWAHELQRVASAALGRERDNFLLQDAIWLLDSLFFPSPAAAPALEAIAADASHPPALRYRAAAARARQIWALAGPLPAAERAFIAAGLRSDDPGVRAAAATAAAQLRDDQLDRALVAELLGWLEAAWAAEPPLALADDPPDPRGAAGISFVESAPSSLTARAAIARAQDRLAGGGRLARLRADYETLALPHAHDLGWAQIRAGLPPEQLSELAAELEQARAMFLSLVGPDLSAPIPGEADRQLSVLIFGRQGVFRDYMRAFTSYVVDVDGVYAEAAATIYTHGRTAAQSENTLAESLRHELSHHLAATHLFPGAWSDPGYHAEPKGWADEGLAELLAGPADPAGLPAARPAQLARLCARPAPPALAELLARRAGYDQHGRFDYDGAWALSRFLHSEHPAAARRIYAAFRAGAPRTDDLRRVAALEPGWHAAIRRWCAAA